MSGATTTKDIELIIENVGSGGGEICLRQADVVEGMETAPAIRPQQAPTFAEPLLHRHRRRDNLDSHVFYGAGQRLSSP